MSNIYACIVVGTGMPIALELEEWVEQMGDIYTLYGLNGRILDHGLTGSHEPTDRLEVQGPRFRGTLRVLSDGVSVKSQGAYEIRPKE